MFCPNCGKDVGESKFCPECGARITVNQSSPVNANSSFYNPSTAEVPVFKKKLYQRWWFWVIVIIILFFIIDPIGTLGGMKNTTGSNSTEAQETMTSISQFKDSCVPLDYNAIARNPSNYEGQYVKFRGKVIQVSESSSLLGDDKNLALRVDSKEDEDGFWEDTVYVEFVLSTDDTRILEDDIVTVYGICSGVTSYKTVLGSSITIPSVDAKYIEVETD